MDVRQFRHAISRRLSAVLLISVIALAPGCAGPRIAQNPQSGRVEVQSQGFNQFSLEQEIELGRQAAAQTEQQLPVLPASDPVSQYIAQLGQKLAAQAPEPKFPYNFKVVNQKEINAFALPGGPIFINLGTIQAAEDEGQVAGVMAHEISHVVLRHGTTNVSRQQMAEMPIAVLGGVLGEGTGAQLARLGLSLGAGSVFLKYGRDAERQSDLLGAQIMADAGFNPYSMAEFFDKLEAEGGSRGPEFLSSHPNPGNRRENVSEAVKRFPRRDNGRTDSPEFRRIKANVDKRKIMTAKEVAQWQQQKQAQMRRAALEQIQPSGDFRRIDHSAFSIGYPSNWEVFGDANSSVTIAPRAGISESAIAYGVVISGFRPQPGRERLDVATQDLIQSIGQKNPDLQVAGSDTTSISGQPAMVVQLRQPSPLSSQEQIIPERNTLVSVQRPDGSVIFMIFIAPEPDMPALKDAYGAMLQSFQLR